ncbi:MAG: class I SAM-dependent methyltransferase [Dehalococcoidia bacterium]|jgi:SAM-dependent methyltransferase
MMSYFGDPEFAERFLSSRRETAGVTASWIIKLADISLGQRVIDLCCGPGLISQHLAERVGPEGEVLGVDASAAMIELARRNVTARNARFIEGAAYALPSLVTTPVDCVVATSAWQNFLLDQERIVPAVRGVLKPSGRFAFDVRLRETADEETSGGPPMMRFWQRVITLLREEYPDVALSEQGKFGPFGAGRSGWRSYGREDIDHDVALMEGSGFRLAKWEEVAGSPFAGAWSGRQRWRVDYWLSRTAPGLSAESRTKILDEVAEEAQTRRSGAQPQVTTVYVVMEASR